MAEKAKKITDEQLKELQETVNKLNQTQMQLGTMELQKHELLHGVAEIQNDLNSNRKKLEEEYGNVSINIADGTITEKEKEDAPNKKD
tara:strand:- start:511 stop:774 length:264 start_codon:yes stop_codon:yes gene_type:complete